MEKSHKFALQHFPGDSNRLRGKAATLQEGKQALLSLADKVDVLLSNQGLTTGVAHVSIQDSSALSALVMPSEMSSPERLKKDLSLSAEAIHSIHAFKIYIFRFIE